MVRYAEEIRRRHRRSAGGDQLPLTDGKERAPEAASLADRPADCDVVERADLIHQLDVLKRPGDAEPRDPVGRKRGDAPARQPEVA